MQAWLDLIPEKDAARNGDKYDAPLPEIPDDHSYLVDWLHQIGTAAAGFDSLKPLPFAEIEAWARLMRFRLSAFEAKAIRVMSVAFAGIANDPKSECPEIDNEDIQNSINEAGISSWIALAKKG